MDQVPNPSGSFLPLLLRQKCARGFRLNEKWILLDNQSTVGVFSNRLLLKNIREVVTIHVRSGNWGLLVLLILRL